VAKERLCPILTCLAHASGVIPEHSQRPEGSEYHPRDCAIDAYATGPHGKWHDTTVNTQSRSHHGNEQDEKSALTV
jgi:hypothetical protein